MADGAMTAPAAPRGRPEAAPLPKVERIIAAVRAVFALTFLAAIGQHPAARPHLALTAVLAMGAMSAAILAVGRRPLRLRAGLLQVTVFGVECACATALSTAYAAGDPLSWIAFLLLIVSGAGRWTLNGSLLAFLLFVAVDAPRDVHLASEGPMVPAVLAIRMGLIGMAASVLGLVTRTFVQFQALRTKTAALERMERLKEMEASVVRVFAEAESLAAGLPRFLEAMCSTMDWCAGQVWSIDAAGERLRLTAGWYGGVDDAPGFEALNRDVAFRRGAGIPGRAWESGAPVVADTGAETVLLRARAFERAGVATAIAVPIATGGQTTGVAELFTTRTLPLDDDLDRALRVLGAQAGLFMARRAEETAHRETATRLQALLDSAADGIITFDERGVIESANHAACDLFRRSAAQMAGLRVDALFAAAEQPDVATRLATRMLEWETDAVRSDGSLFPIDFRARAMQLDDTRLFIATLRDTSERRAQTLALQHQALHDNLTGLPNRALLTDRLQQAIANATRTPHRVALLLMDMDGFKEVNDTLGHHSGDLLLRQVAARLRDTLRVDDTVARLGGDEFAVLPAGPCDESDARTIADKVLAALQAPFLVEEQSIHARMSIGIAVHPFHGEDADTLMRRADVAMYTAKRGHHGHGVYTPAPDEHAKRRLQLTGELRRAIPGRELVLHYQPRMHLPSRSVTALEALVRWEHPVQGLLPPSDFIPVAEQSDLIQPLTAWVAGEAVRQLRAFTEMGLDLSVAINLSARNLVDPRLPSMVSGLLSAWGVPASRLRVEITETVLMASDSHSVLEELRDLGVPISIDDFGVGYSSLAYLQRMPVDEMKIDKSFVSDMVTNPENAAIVRSTIEMGHNLGLKVVAEGVESQECLQLLDRFGCDAVQGYHVSPPITGPQVVEFLLGQGASPATAGMRIA